MTEQREGAWEGQPPETDVRESDPNAEGLRGEGGLGVSSEITDGHGEPYGAEHHRQEVTQQTDEDGGTLPEQSAHDEVPEPNPDTPSMTQRAKPASKPGPGL